MFVGAGEYLQVLGSGVGCVAAAAAAVGGERRVCQSSSPTSHGEDDCGSVLSVHGLLTWSVSSEAATMSQEIEEVNHNRLIVSVKHRLFPASEM